LCSASKKLGALTAEWARSTCGYGALSTQAMIAAPVAAATAIVA